MKDKLILNNNAEIDLEAGASLEGLKVVATDRTAMLATWEQLTSNNLAVVQIKNGDGLVVGNYTDLVLVSETSTVTADGYVLTSYNLRKKTVEEKRMDALEESQAIQDGAIADLGDVTSVLAEQAEGGAR